jgi:hypothetical protein
MAWDQQDSPSGRIEVAVATIASRALGPWVSRRPGRRLSKIPRMPWRANRPRHRPPRTHQGLLRGCTRPRELGPAP